MYFNRTETKKSSCITCPPVCQFSIYHNLPPSNHFEFRKNLELLLDEKSSFTATKWNSFDCKLKEKYDEFLKFYIRNACYSRQFLDACNACVSIVLIQYILNFHIFDTIRKWFATVVLIKSSFTVSISEAKHATSRHATSFESVLIDKIFFVCTTIACIVNSNLNVIWFKLISSAVKMSDNWQAEMNLMLEIFEQQSELSLRKINQHFEVLNRTFTDEFRTYFFKMSMQRLV